MILITKMKLPGLSIAQKLQLSLALTLIIVSVPLLLVIGWQTWLSVLSSAILAGAGILKLLTRKLFAGLQALESGLLNFKDSDFSTLLAYQNNDELGRLCHLYNEAAEQLRDEKQWIYQRELMLDKVLHSAPQALLLTDDKGIVVFSNHSAKALLNCEHNLEGMKLDKLAQQASPALHAAMSDAMDGLFELQPDGTDKQTWHLSNGELLLNNQFHHLYIFKQLTRELNRQEVAVWKKVIRIISHELNNSLGPISSMLHSGKILASKLEEARLERVFSTIDERIRHLTEFVQGYGKFAKLPAPRLQPVTLSQLLARLQAHWQFSCTQTNVLPQSRQLLADAAQLEQLLINLLKNAHESGGDPGAIAIEVRFSAQHVLLSIVDAGQGMSEHIMANALIPFYSTKPSGTGLGLALCREIVEAHHGHIYLKNRPQGGLCVEVRLPLTTI
ncbi:ATP-binding protein [Pseudoalteromonas sp. OOF1S-7]|uniref:sensor histidine kinase n=1 Tax=Pseudoalteromonas sp. OOF1S-7 TaxID=2917757 RepID=UPI001EF6ED4A|nr:ATP-binding protein [Pseudoalteromonas sp. OOF1S-7]MCG7534251.1 ATP-binding protein [Pseudoalteromonas sp. OOF1S-7]